MKGVLSFALLAGPAVALAQVAGDTTLLRAVVPRVSFGIKAGGGWNDLRQGNMFLFSDHDYLAGFCAGGYGRHSFTRFAAVQAELLYVQTGFRGGAYNTPPGTPDPVNHLDYLALPLLFVGQLTEAISFQLGPQAAVLLAARRDAQVLDLGQSNYQRFDLGGVVGAQMQGGPFSLGVRGVYSLFALNQAGTAVTAAGQPLQVLPAANRYHSLLLQACASLELNRLLQRAGR